MHLQLITAVLMIGYTGCILISIFKVVAVNTRSRRFALGAIAASRPDSEAFDFYHDELAYAGFSYYKGKLTDKGARIYAKEIAAYKRMGLT